MAVTTPPTEPPDEPLTWTPSYPYLEDEDITAALTYAAREIDHPALSVA